MYTKIVRVETDINFKVFVKLISSRIFRGLLNRSGRSSGRLSSLNNLGEPISIDVASKLKTLLLGNNRHFYVTSNTVCSLRNFQFR